MTHDSDCSQNDEVQKAFDGEPPEQGVAGHLVDCNPCGGSLRILEVQHDALKFLSVDGEEPVVQPVIRRVLTASAKAGREQLADLLYELSKACLIVNEQAQSRVLLDCEPRRVSAVSQIIRRSTSRLPVGAGDLAGIEGPANQPEPSRAFEAATSCASILENVEGGTSRQQLLMAQVGLVSGNYEMAISVCEQVLERETGSKFEVHALANLTCGLIRTGRFEESVQLGRRLGEQYPDHFMVNYNHAVALACLKRTDEFRDFAPRVAALLEDRQAWKVAMIRSDANDLSTRLCCSDEVVLQLFGLKAEPTGAT